MPLLLLCVVVVGKVRQEQVAIGMEGHEEVVAELKWQCQLITSSLMMIKIKGISCHR